MLFGAVVSLKPEFSENCAAKRFEFRLQTPRSKPGEEATRGIAKRDTWHRPTRRVASANATRGIFNICGKPSFC